MALLPSTAESRNVPVAGRQFAERRLIRGVGAAERAVGNAWGRMTSRQREYYGSQKNFVGGLQRESNRRKSKEEEDEDNAQREQGHQDALGNAPPPKTATAANQAASIVQKAIHSRSTRDYVAKQVEDDMYPEGKPRPKPASEQLSDARKAGRVQDDTDDWNNSRANDEVSKRVEDRGGDGLFYNLASSDDAEDRKLGKPWMIRAKGYQMASQSRFAERRQLRKPGSYGRQY